MSRSSGADQPHRQRLAAALRKAIAEIGGDRAAESASGVDKSVWYDAKTGRAIPDERSTWPAMRDLLVSLPRGRTGVADWDALHAAAKTEKGQRVRRSATADPPRTGPARMVPGQLPPATSVFVAREAELGRLDRVLLRQESGTAPICVLAGPPGVGKTALALHWAHRSVSAFPDGVLYTDLRGWSADQPLAVEAVLPGWLRAFGMEPGEPSFTLADHVAMLRTVLVARRVLMVIDNASSEEQVRLLLPGSPSCSVLVTSRHSLPGIAVHHGGEVVPLNLLTLDESLRLLRRVAGPRADREQEAATALTRLCGRLPLALRIVAEQARHQPGVSLAELAETLADDDHRLDQLDADDPRSDPRTVFSWSYRRLPDDVAATFRLLSLHPGDTIEPAAVAALIGGTIHSAEAHLRVLRRVHLVADAADRRYVLHDLLRLHATELVHRHEPPRSAAAALERLVRHYVHSARHAETLIEPHRHRPALPGGSPATVIFRDRTQAMSWLDTECGNMLALCRLDRPELDPWLWRLAYELKGFFFLTKRIPEWIASHEAALAATIRAADRHGEALTRSNLGVALHERGDDDGALREYQLAHQCFADVGNQHGTSTTLAHQATIYRRRGEFDLSLRLSGRALAYYRRCGSDRFVAITLRAMAMTELDAGRYAEAERHLKESLALCASLAMDMDSARAHRTMGRVLLLAGRPKESEAAYRAALWCGERCASRFEQAMALRGLGAVAQALGDPQQAKTRWQEAFTMLRDLGSAKAQEVLGDLATLS